MYALHLAVNAIRAGDCDAAIVASANWIADPGVQIALDKLGALSASSRCHTFDARAEGYARGEGFAAIYLKRPSLAIADKSPIRAMIRGSAMNSNGRTGGITRPSANGQEAVIREAYRHAGGLSFEDTSYFECHGTGTYVGDPIEVAAVGRVFAPVRNADDPLLVGSVKSNLGHGEGASALASVMKVVLALENGAIPPIFDLQTRNPNIDFDAAKVQPVTEVTPWPKNRLRRASINSFGYGGANAHCIIDHVNNVLPDYVAPGVFKSPAERPTNGLTNGHANGYTNGYQNGHQNGYHNGHQNGYQNGHQNGYQNGYQNGHQNGYHQNGNGHLNGHHNGHHSGYQNGYQNGYWSGQWNGHHDRALPQHHPVVKSPRLTATPDATTRQFVLLPLSAHNEQSLKLNVDALRGVINKFPLADIAYTLAARRSRFAQRSFCIVDKDDAAGDLVVDKKPVRAALHTVNLGFIFTGQGAQWHGMGAELFEYRVFRTAIDYLDSVLGTLPNAPSWSLRSILSGDCDPSLIQTAEVSQAVCTALQVGLVDLLASWSVRPSGVAGHSSGEIAAAYASGRITAAEAIVAAYIRGQAVSRNRQTGAMLAVGLGPDEAAKYLDGREEQVKVAAINSPGSVTLSGDENAIDEVSAEMTAKSVFNRKLKTGGNAYHSHHMKPIGRQYDEMLAEGIAHIRKLGLVSVEDRYPAVPWASSVTPAKSTAEIDDFVSYWRANLESPVRFSEAVTRLLDGKDAPIQALVEIGPHATLKSPLEQIIKAIGATVTYGATVKRQEDGRKALLQLAGTLFTWNAPVNLAAVNAVDEPAATGMQHGCVCTGLPPYQYTYGGLNYYESRASKEYRYRSILRHDLLGSKVAGTAKLRPQWRNILRMKDVPWLADHRLVPDAVLPGAGYLAMAVEAASRVHKEFPEALKIRGFSLRDVAINKSLVIPEDDYGVEILTTLELVDTATGQSPAWATFSISSVGRLTNEWTEHCTGHVKVEVGPAEEHVEPHQVLPAVSRVVDTRAWYEKFLEVGLGYGPAFQPLSNIRADPTSNLAVATVNLHTTSLKGGESRYPLHPASLDGAIQLGLIACHGGHPSEASTAFVPVQLSSLYLVNDIDAIAGDACTVIARGERRGIRSANLDLQMLGPGGEILLQVDGLRCISYSSAAKPVDRRFSSPFTRLVWRPDIRALSNSQARRLYPPPKENVEKSPAWGITNKLAHFVVLSMYETFGKLQDGPKPSGDVGHFFAWIQRKGQNDRSELMEEARELARKGVLLQKIEELASQANDVMEVRIAKLLHDNMADILYERRTGMDVIIGEGLLTPLYQSGLLMTGIYPQLHHVLAGIAHANPNIRVLEIGGGTGGATRIAMKAFCGPNGIKAYRDYTFTDISAGFLSGARESMAEFRDMIFSVFDIEADPVEQGYVLQSYDLIIACQVLHATSNMRRTLENCRKLLKPGGRLVLVETNQNFIVPGVVVGTFTGYWAGIPDGRVDAPFQSLPAWERSLREAGFSGLDVVLDDFPEPHNTTSVIVSTVPTEPANTPRSTTVHVLYSGTAAPSLGEHIRKELEQRGVSVKASTLGEASVKVGPESRVVLLLDEEHLLAKVSEKDLKIFQHLARNAASLVVLTSCGTVNGRNPDGALIPGLLRVLQNENPATQYMSVDVDADRFELGEAEAKDLARCIVDREFKLSGGVPADDLEGDPSDREFSWHDGCLWVSRHVPDAGFHSQHGVDSRSKKPELLPLGSQGALRATFETPGVLNSLCFKSSEEILQPLPPDFVDVAVSAVGLNARDLDHWTGRVDGNSLSSEYAGVITAVGAAVDGLKIGDRVYGLGRGSFGNHTRVPAAFASKLQPGDDMVKMASMPVAYATAIYAFDHVAHLRKGQSVLIQSGAKDVGLASICLAKAKGAEVFATVDTAEQASSLVDKLALPASHVISAPSLTALRRAAQETRKGKFDVVVKIDQGELPDQFLQVLAPLGHLIEVSRVDRPTAPTISLELLPQNASYSSIDLFAVLDSDPTLGAELMRSLDSYHRQGLIGPIPQLTAVDVAQLSTVIGNFANMTGKLVVGFENPDSLVRTIPSGPTVRFDPEACYVIVGALGGLGQSLIRWMGDRGARHMALLSRRHVSSVPGAQELVETLASRDIHVESFVCDVSQKEQVAHVIQKLSTTRPIKGVVHAAVSYLDLTFDKLSAERWNDGLSAKVDGTKNLHEATLSMPLDFFVMITSALSVYAFATQGAYTAANNFQDAFARYRQQLGLPASTVSFSLIREITTVGTTDLTVNLFERNKTLTIGESQFLTLLEPAFLNNRTAEKASPEQWFGQQDDPLSAANLHTYLDPMAMAARASRELQAEGSAADRTPGWYSDGRIALIMRAFRDAQREKQSAGSGASLDEGSKNTAASVRKEFDAAVREGASGRAATVALVEKAIIRAVAEMLFVDAEGIDPAKSVAELGVDSLIAAELRNWFLKALGTQISMLELLDPGISISARAASITDKALEAMA
jgi:acyl transferase domain-containing protein/NADPH:quinone reductase-like Zn-dependent oxidoreductase/SAM-dependent methyltransferase/acyl carrier protein